VLESPGVETLKNRFKNTPALFVNAGPSLDCALPIIKEYADKGIIFCCDTALPALIDNDITPDFVITVDPQERSAEHFENYYDCAATLIFTPTSASEIVRRYTGRKFVVLQKGHSITGSFEKLLGHKGFTHAGGSVSCIGLDLLMNMGCNPLVFVGMDYSFPGGKLYSANIAETKKWVSQVNRLNPMESIHWHAIHGDKVITIKNKYGEDIPTYQTLYTYLRQIEQLIVEHTNVTFYNFLSHGAHIQGADDIFLAEELALLLPNTVNKQIEIKQETIDAALKEQILETLAQ